MTNRVLLLADAEDRCSFCGMPEEEVTKLFIGITGKTICDDCVELVREKMGPVKSCPTLEELLDG